MFLSSFIPYDGTPVKPRVGVTTRVMAKFVDFGVVVVLGASPLPYPLGPLAGFFYSLVADGFHFGPFNGQSLGKKIFGLQVRNVMFRRPARIKDSVLRNAPVGVATFFGIIPVWGWIILGLLGIPLMAMEIYLMMSVSHGHRLGDVMGDTEVALIKEKETHL